MYTITPQTGGYDVYNGRNYHVHFECKDFTNK